MRFGPLTFLRVEAAGRALGQSLIMPSPYDVIAGLYHLQWDNWYVPQGMPALESLFFPHVRPGAHLLDVCCGSGHVTRELAARGYRVTGIDNSPGLLELARRDVPLANFVQADVRNFRLTEKFDGALSTFDSMNHLLTPDDLTAAFASVYAALEPGARFVFDMNSVEAYSMDWAQWSAHVSDESVSLVKGRFDPTTSCAETEVIWFVKAENGMWQRQRTVVPQRCYQEGEVRQALEEAGFATVSCTTALQAGVTGEIGYGRVFYSAVKAS